MSNLSDQDLARHGVYRAGFKTADGKSITFPAGKGAPENTSPEFRYVAGIGVPDNLFTNGTEFPLTLPKGSSSHIHHISLKIGISLSAAAQLVPVTNFFKKIELRTTGGVVLRTWYNDTMALGLSAATPGAKFVGAAKNLLIDTRPETLLGMMPTLTAGTYTFFLPLISSLWEDGLYWKAAASDLVLQLFPDSTVVASGAGVVTCTSLGCRIEGENVAPKVHERSAIIAKQFAESCLFTQPSPVYSYNKALQVGSNTIDLTSVAGKIAFLQVVIRATGASNVGNGYWKLLNIGDNQGATIDVLDASSSSMMGGTPIETKFLRNELWSHHFDNAHGIIKPHYLIPHTKSMQESFGGYFRGYREYFAGSSDKLELVCAAPVAEVQTLTSSQDTTTSGFFRFYFRGEYSNPIAVAATIETLAAAIAGMRTFARNNITASFNKTFAAATIALPVVVTFTTPETNGLEGDLLQVVSDSLATAGNVLAQVTTTRTTAGRDGIAPGNYDVTVYAYVVKISSFVNGELVVKNWTG